MIVARCHHSSVVANSKIFVIGGAKISSFEPGIEVLELLGSNKVWKGIRDPLVSNQEWPVVCPISFTQQVVICGGDNGCRSILTLNTDNYKVLKVFDASFTFSCNNNNQCFVEKPG